MDGLSKYYFCAAETRLTLTPYFRKILAGCLPAIVAVAPPICVALKAIPHFTFKFSQDTNAAGTTFDFPAPRSTNSASS